jgi:hypothetical protein
MYDDAAPLGANAISTPSTIKQRLSAVANLLLNADRLKQAPKTELSISLTESGMVIVDRLKQFQKAPVPIAVTLLGIVILVSSQLANAYPPIFVTLFGILYVVRPLGAKEFRTPSTIKHRLSVDANLP